MRVARRVTRVVLISGCERATAARQALQLLDVALELVEPGAVRAHLLRFGPPEAIVVAVPTLARRQLLEEIGMLVDGPVALVVLAAADEIGETADLEAGAWEWLTDDEPASRIAVRVQRQIEVARGVRRRDAAIERLTRLSLTDDVTGLGNQRRLYAHLDDELERARLHATPLGILMLDIDDFKRVNDGFDHLFGSQVLRELGGLMRVELPRASELCRFGGDEFFAILPGVDLVTAVACAEQLRTAVANREFHYDYRTIAITVSVGVGSFPEVPAAASTELLRRVDEALYAAKAAGRNRTVIAARDLPLPGDRSSYPDRLEALVAGSGEFVVG